MTKEQFMKINETSFKKYCKNSEDMKDDNKALAYISALCDDIIMGALDYDLCDKETKEVVDILFCLVKKLTNRH